MKKKVISFRCPTCMAAYKNRGQEDEYVSTPINATDHNSSRTYKIKEVEFVEVSDPAKCRFHGDIEDIDIQNFDDKPWHVYVQSGSPELRGDGGRNFKMQFKGAFECFRDAEKAYETQFKKSGMTARINLRTPTMMVVVVSYDMFGHKTWALDKLASKIHR